MTQGVAQNAQSNMLGAGSLYLESVKVSQQDDHHDEKIAAQKKEHGDNLTARKKHHDENMSLEADQHNDNMAHAEKVEQRSTLKEERLLLRQRFTDFSNKACGLFWLCVIFLVVVLMDYHWSHALQDFCSYAEKLNWLRSVAQWMTPLNQSWSMSYVLSYVFRNHGYASDAVCSDHTLDECTNESCPAALTSVFIFGSAVLSLMIILPANLKTVFSVLVSLLLLYKTSESTANQVVFYHLLALVFLKVVFLGLIWSVVDTQYYKESVEEVVNARDKFPFYVKLLCFCYVLLCVSAYVFFYCGWFA